MFKSKFRSVILGSVTMAGLFCLSICLYYLIFGVVPLVLQSPELFHPDILDLPITAPVIPGRSFHINLIGQVSHTRSNPISNVAFGESKVLIDELDHDLQILDVSNPTKPYFLNSYISSGSLVLFDVKIQGNFAYLGTKDGLQILDISASGQARLVGDYKTSKSIEHLDISNNFAYLIDTDDGIYVLDITEPSQPQLLSFYKKLKGINFINDIVVVGKYMYLTDDTGVHVIDVSNPAHLTEIGSFTVYYGFWATGKNQITIINNFAFLKERYKKAFEPITLAYLTILDISNPSKPAYVISYKWCDDCYVAGARQDLVYLQMGNELHLVDFSYPKAPVELGYYGLPSEDNYGWALDALGVRKDGNINVVHDEGNFYIFHYEP